MPRRTPRRRLLDRAHVPAADAAAHRRGIAVVLLHHNTLLTYLRHLIFDRTIDDRFDEILAFGRGETEALRRWGGLRARLHNVGSIRLDRLRADRATPAGSARRPVVLLAGGLYCDSFYGLDWSNYSDTSPYEIHARIVRLFKERSDVSLLLRPFPWHKVADPIPSLARREVPGARVDLGPPSRTSCARSRRSS